MFRGAQRLVETTTNEAILTRERVFVEEVTTIGGVKTAIVAQHVKCVGRPDGVGQRVKVCTKRRVAKALRDAITHEARQHGSVETVARREPRAR